MKSVLNLRVPVSKSSDPAYLEQLVSRLVMERLLAEGYSGFQRDGEWSRGHGAGCYHINDGVGADIRVRGRSQALELDVCLRWSWWSSLAGYAMATVLPVLIYAFCRGVQENGWVAFWLVGVATAVMLVLVLSVVQLFTVWKTRRIIGALSREAEVVIVQYDRARVRIMSSDMLRSRAS